MAYAFARSVTVDESLCGTGDSTNFPVLFHGTYSYLATVANGGKVQHASGYDIGFFSDAGLTTPLDWEVVEYNATTGYIEAHVRIPTLSASTDTVFYLAYGDSGISTFQGDVAGTWDSNFKLVAHMPDGTTLAADDSTSNGNDGTVTGAVAATGKVGGAARFDGSGDKIDFGSPSSLDSMTALTLETWVRRDTISGSADDYLLSKAWDSGSGYGGWALYVRRNSDATNGNKVLFSSAWTGSTFETAIWRGTTQINTTTAWYRVVVTYDGSSSANDPIIYINGAAETIAEPQSPSGTLKSDSSNNVLAGDSLYGSAVLDGYLDEVRISNVVRSASYVVASYNNQVSPSTFYAVGSEAITLACDAGSYAVTGTDAALLFDRVLACDPGVYTITGTDATLTYDGADPSLDCDAGVYTLTGTDAALLYHRVLACDPGVYTITGTDATLTKSTTVTLDSATVYQTMRGWEVTAQAGEAEANADLYIDSVFELAGQYGVDAVRLEVKDEWETSDGVYDWSLLDAKVTDVIRPLQAAATRHGRTLHINLCYVAFGTHSGLHTTAANYADFMLAAVQYLDTTHGLTLDTIEIILEPDNPTGAGVHLNTGAEIGAALKATGDLLATNGYTPGFIVPSTLAMGAAPGLYDTITGVSGAAAYITMISYHRYSTNNDTLLGNILSRVTADGIESGMLEHILSGAEDLWADLTKANVSMWQQYCLAYPTTDDGAQLFPIISNVATIGSRTPGLSQYYKYVRRGATRIAATSADANVRPVAFINPDGSYAVVVHADASGTYTVSPVPAGSYYVTRSSASAARTPLGIVTVGGDGIASLALNSGDIATLAPIEGLASGAIEITGTDANLEFNRRLEAGSGSFAVTGTDAALKYNRLLSAGSGSFAVTGTDASLEFNRRLSAESGTFTVTGSDATLTYNSVGSYTLSCESGTFAVTGSDAALKMNRRLAADSGSFAVTGTDADLLAHRRLSADSGSFTVTGSDATLVYGQPGQYTLVAESGTFTVTGFAANLLVGRLLSADSGTVAITGSDATLLAHRRLTAESGAFTITGTAASLLYSAATSTAFTVTRESGPRYQITRESGTRYRNSREG